MNVLLAAVSGEKKEKNLGAATPIGELLDQSDATANLVPS